MSDIQDGNSVAEAVVREGAVVAAGLWAGEGPGDAGVLAMRISHELGSVDSVSRSRIVTCEQETLIAQLTVTALHESPADRENIWLSIRANAAAPRPTSDPGGTPVARTEAATDGG